MSDIKSSNYEYKNYIINITFRSNTYKAPAEYKIISKIPNINSPNGIKHLIVKRECWTYQLPNVLIQRAKNYIDNHEDNIKQKETNWLERKN